MLAKLTRWSWLSLGTALVVLPLLPLTGAVVTGLPWAAYLQAWSIGLASVLAVGVVAGILAQRASLAAPKPPLSLRATILLLAVILLVASTWVMLSVFMSNPHLVDEMAQLLHAKAFAAGRLAAPTPEPAEAFLITHTGLAHDKNWFSQYPPGFTAILALGLLLHAEWLVNPVLGGVSVVLVYYVARGLFGPKTGLTAAVIWALTPWVMFMSGTYMNHVPATTFALAACALLWAPRRPRTWHALAAGCAVAGVAANRPLDAVAVALPIVFWIVLRRRWRVFPLLVLGGAPVLFAWAFYNWRVFGSPFTLGYDLLWGTEHGLGFHQDPWGESYTPRVAITNLTLALQRLNIYLYEWPIPALLPVTVWTLAGRQRRWGDRILLVALVSAPALYFFYWHSGFYLGPRFYFAAAPFIVIATARAWRWAWRGSRRVVLPRFRTDAALAAAAGAVIVWGWVGIVPDRVSVYRTGLASMKQHPERELALRGVSQALVLVPESFGSRVLAGLWSARVRPGFAERAYRRLDTCELYQLLLAARAARVEGPVIESRLMLEMTVAPAAPPRLESWPDPTLRLRPGSTPPEVCQVELRRDLDGFTVYGYLGWRNPSGNDSGIVFARDLFERNEELLRRYPGWAIWRYAPPPGRPDTLAVLTLVRPAGRQRASP